ncbi:hypothetical protein [Ekhidna sp.]|uniref:hypothetical protein n=1 Tax=Ekhidna sp. TaxID=2608089 RepID=UPI003296A4EC
MKRYFFLIAIGMISGCVKNHPDIEIYNQSDSVFDSLHVYAHSNRPTTFKNIQLDSKHSGRILFDESIKYDGAYQIDLFNNGEIVKHYNFGYFTNGSSLNRSFNVKILNDSIKVEMN